MPSIVVSMVIDTPANGFVTTSWVCLNFPWTIHGQNFGIDLIFLPLSQLDVTLEMNWLEFNFVHINCFDFQGQQRVVILFGLMWKG